MSIGSWIRSARDARTSPFDLLVDEMAAAQVARARRPRLRLMTLDRAMAKSLAAGNFGTHRRGPSTRKRDREVPLLFSETRPSAGSVMAKALATLDGSELNADQRGRLLLAIGDVDPAPIQQAAKQAIAQLDEVERQLAAGATESHLRAAAVLVREARALMASGKMTAGDHAALGIAISSLRAKIEGGEHAGG